MGAPVVIQKAPGGVTAKQTKVTEMHGNNPLGFGPGASGYGTYKYNGDVLIDKESLVKQAVKNYVSRYGPKVRVLSTDASGFMFEFEVFSREEMQDDTKQDNPSLKVPRVFWKNKSSHSCAFFVRFVLEVRTANQKVS